MKKFLLIGLLILSFKSFAQTGIGVGSTVHIIFVCDRSSSMEGDRIAQLNNALQQFYEDIKKQDLLKKNIQVAFVAFDSKIDIIGFQKIEANSQAPQFTAQNMTNMAEALQTSQKLIPQNLKVKPVVILITDGKPNEGTEQSTKDAAKNIREKAYFEALGVNGADFDFLKEVTDHKNNNTAFRKLNDNNFTSFFKSVTSGLTKYIELSTPNPKRLGMTRPKFTIPTGDWEKQ